MIERSNRIARTVKRIATITGLSGLLLTAGFDWAAAATFAEAGGPGNAEMFVIVLFAAGFSLLAALIRQGRPGHGALRMRVSARRPLPNLPRDRQGL